MVNAMPALPHFGTMLKTAYYLHFIDTFTTACTVTGHDVTFAAAAA